MIQYFQTRSNTTQDLERKVCDDCDDLSIFRFPTCSIVFSAISIENCFTTKVIHKRSDETSNTLTAYCIIIDDHAFFQLAGAGYGVGVRMLELVSFRDKQCKREIKASSLTCTPRSNHFSFGSSHWVFEILAPSIIFFNALQIVAMLSFIKETMWKTMFGKPADSLERVTDKEDECAFYPEVSSRLDQGLPISLPLSVSPSP
jgi:hypothetical protein